MAVWPLLSVAVFAAALFQLRGIDFGALRALIPHGIGFWLAFAVYYLAGPLFDFAIFRRLWRLPARGFPVLLGKFVSNEILLGYLGEVYFYTWARRSAGISTAPFGAIKDVTILSALIGNLSTLVLVILAAPLFNALYLPLDTRAFVGSAGFILTTSMVVLLFRRRLFTLGRRELAVISVMHMARLVTMIVFLAIMWHIVLPVVALRWWILLGAVRQLISRLPFIPNKDVVFAGVAAFLIGRNTEIAAAMTLMASIILATHLAVGLLVTVNELLREGAAKRGLSG